MVANDIVNKARMALGDEKAERWSENRLLDIVDEAQKDICLQANMYKKDEFIPLVTGQAEYELPEDLLVVETTQTLAERLPYRTKHDMDETVPQWRLDHAEFVTHIIKDSIALNKIRVYPIPSGEMFYLPTYQGITTDANLRFEMVSTEGVVSQWETPEGDIVPIEVTEGVYVGSQIAMYITGDTEDPLETLWGGLTDWYELTGSGTFEVGYLATDWSQPDVGVMSDGSLTNSTPDNDITIWGCLTDIDPLAGYLTDTWGVVTSIIQEGSVIQVSYIAEPPPIGSPDTPLILGNIWATALKYYVAGYALLDDNDAGNIERGNNFISRYGRELAKAQDISTIEASTSSGARAVQYQTGFRR